MSSSNLIFEEMRKLFYYHSLIERKVLFSKKITIDYKAGSYDPWLNFNCLSDEGWFPDVDGYGKDCGDVFIICIDIL